MSARRITRKQMKKDEFVSTVTKMVFFVEEHWKPFAYGAWAIAMIALGVFSTIFYSQYREEKLKQALNKGIEYFHASISEEPNLNIYSEQPSFQTEKEKYREALKVFRKILEEDPHSSVASLALYYSGLSHFHLEKYHDASIDLERFIKQAEDTLLKDIARSSLAQAYFKEKDYEASIRVWSELAEDETSLYPRADALLHLAEAKDALGEKKEAMEIYKRITEEFPGTTAATEALKILS